MAHLHLGLLAYRVVNTVRYQLKNTENSLQENPLKARIIMVFFLNFDVAIFFIFLSVTFIVNQAELQYQIIKNEKRILLFQHDVPAFICKLHTTG